MTTKRDKLDNLELTQKTKKGFPTRMGFEPTRAEHNGLAVHRLNHSATSSYGLLIYSKQNLVGLTYYTPVVSLVYL